MALALVVQYQQQQQQHLCATSLERRGLITPQHSDIMMTAAQCIVCQPASSFLHYHCRQVHQNRRCCSPVGVELDHCGLAIAKR